MLLWTPLLAQNAKLKSVTTISNGGKGMELIEIPAGNFRMGEGNRVVAVSLTKPFLLGQYEVTQGQFKKVMDLEPWLNKSDVQIGEDNAASWVSWKETTDFCKKLTEIERKDGTLKGNEEYRLPTEAEWEYACRAGTTTAFSFGDDESKLGDYAWFDRNTFYAGEKYAHKVGFKKPNPWGLYDMHGNVWEWCSDWFSGNLSGGVDPVGPGGGSGRIIRGGGWKSDSVLCRSALRNEFGPLDRGVLGFRVARSQSE